MIQPAIRPAFARRLSGFLYGLGLCCLLLVPETARAQQPTPAQEAQTAISLELGKGVEREIVGEQLQSYRIRLAAGQYVKVMVEQRSIDTALSLLSPDGKKLTEAGASESVPGTKTVLWIASVVGEHRFQVQASRRVTDSGRYEIRVAELRSATATDNDLVEAQNLHNQAATLRSKFKISEALALEERAVGIWEKALGLEHPDVASARYQFGILYYLKNDLAKAEASLRRALAIRQKIFGTDHSESASVINVLGLVSLRKGDLAKAGEMYQQALAIMEKQFGVDSPYAVSPLQNLTSLAQVKGEYDKAEQGWSRILEIQRKAFGDAYLGSADILRQFAWLYETYKSDYAKAETLYLRAIAISERRLGVESRLYVTIVHDLGVLYRRKGDYAKAAPMFEQALNGFQKLEDVSNVAVAGYNLGLLARIKGDYAKAEKLLLQSLALREKLYGPQHYLLIPPIYGLGLLYENKKEYAQAEDFYQRALAIQEKTFGAEHPELVATQTALARLYSQQRKYEQAESLFQRTLSLCEKVYGANHPIVANTLGDFAEMYHQQGNTSQTLAMLTRYFEIGERHINRNLVSGSDRQKLAFLRSYASHINGAISLHAQLAPDDSQSLRLALSVLLRFKGRALDTTTDNLVTLRRVAAPEDQTFFDQLSTARSELAKVAFGGPNPSKPDTYRAQLRSLEERVEKLETEIGLRSRSFNAQFQPITLSSVQPAISNQATLIEYALYHPLEPLTLKSLPPRYVAYTLTAQDEPRWVDLGDAAAIDKAIEAWRKALRDPKRNDVRRLARVVDEKVMRPVRALLGDAKHLLIAPDGLLNLIPFAALVDERNRYLVESYSIGYLTSGRDLLRLQVPRESRNEAVIVADPAFGIAALRSDSEAKDERSRLSFQPLPVTADEADGIKKLLPKATVLMQKEATEAAIKRLVAPRILHIATHGFFLNDQQAPPADARGSLAEDPLRTPDARLAKWSANLENPLLRSGLALTGANLGKSGEDDGLLTALEAAGLNLWGTKLVVLSACDTGVGEVKNGEGVYGLRRALVLAGAETLLMSLWPVSDLRTKELMLPYYAALERGAGRGEALRQVQLKMIRGKQRHPFYWASFVQLGEWANLDGKR